MVFWASFYRIFAIISKHSPKGNAAIAKRIMLRLNAAKTAHTYTICHVQSKIIAKFSFSMNLNRFAIGIFKLKIRHHIQMTHNAAFALNPSVNMIH